MTLELPDPAPDEELILPDLPTRPLFWRRVGVISGLVLATCTLLYLAFQMAWQAPNTLPPLACDQPDVVVYRLDPLQSKASYELDVHHLQTDTYSTLTGQTSALSGYVVVDPTRPAASLVCNLQVQLTALEAEGLLTPLMESAHFTQTRLTEFPAEFFEKLPIRFYLQGDLTLGSITRPVTWEVRLIWNGNRLDGRAETAILMSEFGGQPLTDGALESADDITLFFDFVAVRDQ